MEHDGFHHLGTRGEHGVQGGHGLLEDHGDLFTADAAHLAVCEIEQVLTENEMDEPGSIDETMLGSSCIIESEVTDFPLPDSPTMPRVCPGLMEILRSSTALTVPPSVLK